MAGENTSEISADQFQLVWWSNSKETQYISCSYRLPKVQNQCIMYDMCTIHVHLVTIYIYMHPTCSDYDIFLSGVRYTRHTLWYYSVLVKYSSVTAHRQLARGDDEMS